MVRGKRRIGFEWKRAEAPTMTKSMVVAQQDLRLDELYVVHGGQECWQMGKNVRAVAARRLLDEIEPMRRS